MDQPIPRLLNFAVDEEEDISPEMDKLISNLENQHSQVIGVDTPDSLPSDYYEMRKHVRENDPPSLYNHF